MSNKLGNLHNKQSTKEKRRELKKNMTKAEKILWEKLRARRLDYKINRNLVLGYVKDRFIDVLIDENKEKMNKAYKRIVKLASKNLVSIRKGRHFSREQIHKTKFPFNKKRTI